MKSSVICLCFFIVAFYFVQGIPYKEEIILVHTLFRHGERTPDNTTRYPNDPYINEQYLPYGRGILTNEGRKTCFNMGKALRKKYDNFLSKTFSPNEIYARSSGYNRTRISLQMALLGLYNSVDFKENSRKNIYYEYKDKNDYFLMPFLVKNFAYKYGAYVGSLPTTTEDLLIYEYLSKHAGGSFTSLFNVYEFYMVVLVEKQSGKKLPEWVEKIFPGLEKYAMKLYLTVIGNDELKTFHPGYILKEILSNSELKINENQSPMERKMFIYAGHDINLAAVLLALGYRKFDMPTYGSYLTFETVQRNGIYGYKVFYQNYRSKKPELLKIPKCDTFCPMGRFKNILKEYLPQEKHNELMLRDEFWLNTTNFLEYNYKMNSSGTNSHFISVIYMCLIFICTHIILI